MAEVSNAFVEMAKASAAAKAPAAPPKRQPRYEPQSRSPQFQRPNPSNNAGGVPRRTGSGERQLDGTRTPEFSQPQKKPGLAERQPAPHKSSGGSGLEHAMGSLADQLHPRRQGPKGR